VGLRDDGGGGGNAVWWSLAECKKPPQKLQHSPGEAL